MQESCDFEIPDFGMDSFRLLSGACVAHPALIVRLLSAFSSHSLFRKPPGASSSSTRGYEIIRRLETFNR